MAGRTASARRFLCDPVVLQYEVNVVSSDPKKILHSDQTHDDAADGAALPVGDPPTDRPDELDRLVFNFLEHANSVTAEYESSHETSTEQVDALLSELSPETDVSAHLTGLAAAIPAAVDDATARTDPPPSTASQSPDTAPLPFIRPANDLDESIAHTIDDLEQLSAVDAEEPAPVVPEVPTATPEPLEVPGPALAQPDASLTQATVDADDPGSALIDPSFNASAIAVTPASEETPAAVQDGVREVADEYERPLWTLNTQPEHSRRKILIRVGIIVYLVITAILLYFLFRPRPRSAPSPTGASAVPAEGPAEETTPPALPASAVDNGPQAPEVTAAAKQPSQEAIEPEPGAATKTRRSGNDSSPPARALNEAGAPRTRPPDEIRQVTPTAPPPVAPAAAPAADDPQVTQAPAGSVGLQGEHAAADTRPAAEEPTDPAPGPPATSTAANLPSPTSTSLPAAAPAPRLPTASPSSGVPAANPSGTQAVLLSRVLPVFPDIARKRNISGTVDLEIEIDAQGRVTKAKPISGPQLFHAAAEDAVRKWRFKPATLGGSNVASQGKVTVVFTNQR